MSSIQPLPITSAPLAFLSDVHGNLPALEAVLAELARLEVQEIYVAGDLVLGGDHPLEVWRRLQDVQAVCIRGVSDTALVMVDPSTVIPLNDEQKARFGVFVATRQRIGELVLEQIRRLPESHRIPLVDGREVVMVHGSPNDPKSEISHDMSDEEIMSLVDSDPADIVMCGASHVAFQRDLDGVRIVSVGSVGQSPEGRTAHFTILSPRMDGPIIDQRHVEY
ncbi:MAG: metallophosphoesterase family protein [Myxococcales bacterium]|nr:metallophosphoesterase family protein [Myxococcales bacterium]